MKRSRRLASLLAVAILVVALAGTANAVCVQSGRIVYSTHTPFASTYWLLTAQIGLPTWYYSYTTNDSEFISSLSDAHANGKWVRLWGSAAACPAAGPYRNAGALISPWLVVY